MVQFKRAFLGQDTRPYRRATTCQKCVRAGGKHNDLEQVGHTKRHHTFFEMLGNFSFGDYFKRDAIAFAWEFVTSPEYLGLAPERLRVTVHHTDHEARELWREIAKLPDDRIYGLGDKDNFWQMGDTGPCGPCSEIYVDLEWPGASGPAPMARSSGPETRRDSGPQRTTRESGRFAAVTESIPAEPGRTSGGHARISGKHGRVPEVVSQEEFEKQAEAGRYLEIWNLVFMQFDRSADGTLTPLPKPSVDTGAGLERIAAVLQGEDNNFHTDLFLTLIQRASELIGQPYDRGPAGAPFRVLADHARAVSFLLADGVYPSNEGRGYVLRRILRRAVRHAWLLGRRAPTLAPLTEVVVDEMGEAYPELVAKRAFIADVTRQEEERFLETIEGGLERLDQLFYAGLSHVSGQEAFKLYDTFGFPVDLTQVIAAERGGSVDLAGFEVALEQQRERSRSVRQQAQGVESVGEMAVPNLNVGLAGTSRFVGYTEDQVETTLEAAHQAGEGVRLRLKESPFYVESGGQVSDTGRIVGPEWIVQVDTVRKTPEGPIAEGRVIAGTFHGEPGLPVRAEVDVARRRDIERNHSATHLVHHVLRKRLGDHVRQQGSRVEPDRLRFDFSHHAPIDHVTLDAIQREVNELAWENFPVETREMPYTDALALGAMAFFSEKYGDRVRVVTMGPSIELCGGTHVRGTGQLGLFRFAGQGGVAAGVRRIEAVTGPEAYQAVGLLQERLQRAAETVRAQPDQLLRKLEALVQEREKLEARIAELKKSGGPPPATEGTVLEVGGVSVTMARTDSDDRAEIGAVADRFREGRSNAVLVLFGEQGRGAVHVAVTDDLVKSGRKAGDLVNRIAALSGGKGGGRPQFASAGAGDPTRLGAALEATPGVVAAWLQE
jgi:alanyl-tRNA synthetase